MRVSAPILNCDWISIACLALVAAGCDSEQTKRCFEEYEQAQKRVVATEARTPESVAASLNAVEAALGVCRQANRHGEVDQLVKARNELVAQQGVLERRARRKPRKEPTPEQLDALARTGDPGCPRGQAYRHGAKEIRCTGRQLLELGLAAAKEYFEERDYRVRSPNATTLEAEHGAERYTFVYAESLTGAPSCVVLVPVPGVPWKEALARASGANPSRMQNPGTLRVATKNVPYVVDEEKVIVRIGACPAGT